MERTSSTLLKSAAANQANEDDIMARLDDARIMRALLWVDFYSNLDDPDIARLRHKLAAWEDADTQVGRLEEKAGLYNQHRTWVANYQKLVEVGYKE